jgi:hypothetical protein
MNRGQVLIPEGDGRWKYRDDVKVPASALAIEAWRAVKARRAEPVRKRGMAIGPITYKGKTQSVMAWAHELGINVDAVYQRLYRGWTIEQALGTGPSASQAGVLFHEKVLNALRNAHEKLGTRDLCERVQSSVSSKRVEKALRFLCDRGLVEKIGRTKGALYCLSSTEKST